MLESNSQEGRPTASTGGKDRPLALDPHRELEVPVRPHQPEEADLRLNARQCYPTFSDDKHEELTLQESRVCSHSG